MNDTEEFKENVVEQSDDIPSQLERYADLKQRGIISEEEFNKKKPELLDQ